MELIEEAGRQGAFDARPDVIFVTSMVSGGDLRALLPVGLRNCPLVIYMHENQAVYPFRSTTSMQKSRDHQFALTNLTSLAAADLVIWNSHWNQESFCEGIEELLDKSPDGKLRQVRGWVSEKSIVCWPPVEPPNGVLHNTQEADNTGRGRMATGITRIVWPHRWEHDKGPNTLLRLARYLRHRSPGRYRWTLLGEQYRKIPRSLDRFLDEFTGDIDHAGWVESREEYWSHLKRCDWVLSTARHEFFGIAVVEAMLAGCLPWLPNRLSYPEITPAVAHGLSPEGSIVDRAEVQQCLLKHLEPCVPRLAVGNLDNHLETIAGR